MHGRRQNVNIVVEELIELLRSAADGKYALSLLQGLTLIGDLAGLIQVEVAIAHEFCMHAQVPEV